MVGGERGGGVGATTCPYSIHLFVSLGQYQRQRVVYIYKRLDISEGVRG